MNSSSTVDAARRAAAALAVLLAAGCGSWKAPPVQPSERSVDGRALLNAYPAAEAFLAAAVNGDRESAAAACAAGYDPPMPPAPAGGARYSASLGRMHTSIDLKSVTFDGRLATEDKIKGTSERRPFRLALARGAGPADWKVTAFEVGER